MFLCNYIVSLSGYQTLLKDPVNKSEYSNEKKATLPVPHRRCCQRSQASQETACLCPVINTQSRHGGYKMQVTMTIPNWDLILNPSTRAFYTDYVGELKKVFQQKIVFVCF